MSSPYSHSLSIVPDLGRRTGVVALVVGLHLLALMAFDKPDGLASVASPQISVALVSVPEVETGKRTSPPKTFRDSLPETGMPPKALVPQTESVPPVPADASVSEVANPAVPAALPETPSREPVVTDHEPDYKANYLQNPAPVYPLSARRMGLQGKVVLDVEVLAEGRCGQISVRQSSGFEVLDHAALQTVKEWRFAPAMHAGLAVTRWFQVPVNFRLRNEPS